MLQSMGSQTDGHDLATEQQHLGREHTGGTHPGRAAQQPGLLMISQISAQDQPGLLCKERKKPLSCINHCFWV